MKFIKHLTDLLLGPRGASAGNTGRARFYELAANGEHSVDLQAPDSLAATTPYTLPTGYPASSGYVLASTTGGVLSWASAGAGGSRDVSIINFATIPTNGWYPVTYDYYATNDFWKHLHIASDTPSADLKIAGRFEVPLDYVGTAKLQVVWTSTVTTGNFGIEFAYRVVAGNDAESMDQATAQETVNTTDVAPGAANRRLKIELSLTSANFTAGSTVEFYFARDDSADTITGVVQLIDLRFQYTI